MRGRERLCVYSHTAAGRIFYVGRGRLSRPYDQTSRSKQWRDHVKSVGEYDVIVHAWTENREQAKRIEAEMIAAHAPACNRLPRDNKTYRDTCSSSSILFGANLREGLKQADMRPMSHLVQKIIADWLKEKGYVK